MTKGVIRGATYKAGLKRGITVSCGVNLMDGVVIAISAYQVAEEISGPLTSANKITLVSSGSGTMGASKVTGEVLDILSRLPESVERLTGVSISQVRGNAECVCY